MKDERDTELWKEAKARAGFKTHLILYLAVNLSLWTIWFLTGRTGSYPWPIWPTVGWGIGIISNYLGVYKLGSTAEKEYEKLKGQRHSTEP
ncbi:MAG: 2TM domain-containing protein [Bacteroidota bacterium]|nr:2TM domain-containing protein [Bacteroidota bacterium]MDP4216386.1 2TM domain-containing protein [Bacteroidota bacterium]MDP4245519.1 2TM domain-containing protein [Bacteroidota bacterium]MDP4255633.1 2TM domain-containing protein [Bacteroidota bacterium]MDP4258978.1 2TM domain-containing protein [Bacteroidota bacterium]